MAARVCVGDVGVEIRLTCVDNAGDAINLSTATPKQIIVRDPNNAVAETLTASFYTTGTDGILTATTTASSFTTSGTWRAVAYFTLGSFVGSSAPLSISVHPVGAP